MVSKLGLTYLFSKSKDVRQSTTPPWPSCMQPRTSSFRHNSRSPLMNSAYKTMNSAYTDSTESFVANSYSTAESAEISSSSSSSEPSKKTDPVEELIHSVRSDRLFFEPGKTSSIMAEPTSKKHETTQFEANAIAVEMYSSDPYSDFRKSMEEMVMAHGVRDWDWLEQMLGWYLSVNGKTNHGIILGAFVDLLLGLASNSDCSCSSCLNCSSFNSNSNSNCNSNSSSSFKFEIEEGERERKIESSLCYEIVEED